MTERERWTVYPLLFLSLAISLRSKITSSLDLHEITCQTLKCREVEIDGGEDGSPRIVLAALPPAAGGGGAIQVLSAAGRPEVALRALPHGGQVDVALARGLFQVVLGVAPPGGIVEAFDAQGNRVRGSLAVEINPFGVAKVGPPPAPPAEEPSGDAAEPNAEKPPNADEPAGEKPSATQEESAETPAEKPADR